MPRFLTIDCPPLARRPKEILKDMGALNIIKEEWFTESGSCFFGEQNWQVQEEHLDAYMKARDDIGLVLKGLHESGFIRYASW